MIPKVIHYIWLGGKPKTNLINMCINSWYDNLEDYEIIEWNESNLNLDKIAEENMFFSECRNRKLWAYMADYLRLRILYENGGIYLDTDVQVLKDVSPFLGEKMFLGLEIGEHYGTGIIAAEKNSPIIKKILEFYEGEIWNSKVYTIPWVFKIVQEKDKNLFSEALVLPMEYFSPYDYNKKFDRKMITSNTYTIHWFDGSWKDNLQMHVFLETKHIRNKKLRKIYQCRKYCGYYLRKYFKR